MTVVVDERADKLVSLQHRELLERVRLGQHIAGLEQLTTRHQVVALDSRVVIR